MTKSDLQWGDREVVITGVGMVTPVGGTTMETWRALLRGDNGIGPISRFDASTFPVQFAAECQDLEILDSKSMAQGDLSLLFRPHSKNLKKSSSNWVKQL